MKILVFEDPNEHWDSVNPRSIYPNIEASVGIEGGESELVKSIRDAEDALSRSEYDCLIYHHFDNFVPDYFRKKYPSLPLAAISAMIYPEDKCAFGDWNYEFRVSLKPHYDYLLHDYVTSIREMMRDLETRKLKNK